MDAERHRRITELFQRVLTLDPSARERILDQECAGDPELAAEVRELLQHDRGASGPGVSGIVARVAGPLLEELSERSPIGRIGAYTLVREIGRGGMGVVYLAEQLEPLRRYVAVKVIKAGMDTEQVIRRFESERHALALMAHPNIARVYDAGATAEGRPYFVMEYVAGRPIDVYCDECRLDLRDRLHLFVQVCAGVQHAHQKGIIHRDIKPSNVLVVTEDGVPVPKIIDFGIAKAIAPDAEERGTLTDEGQFIGTLEYMSPEQIGANLDVDTRTDVYALGTLLYVILAGALPFDFDRLRRDGSDAVIRTIREESPPVPSKRRAFSEDVPIVSQKQLQGDLDWIVTKALEKERERRYGSPAELAADVTRHLRDEPVVARPPTTTYRLKKFVRRHRVGVAAAAFIVVALIAGMAGTSIGLVRAVRAERAATAARLLASDEAEREAKHAKTAEQVSDFLVDLFRASDPSQARGNSITAREILDRGALKIRRELGGQPQVQARLMDTMGRVFRNLGLYGSARPLLEEALRIRQTLPIAADLDIAASLSSLGVLEREMGNASTARKLFQRSLELHRRVVGPESIEAAGDFNNLGTLEYDLGNFQEARRFHEKALVIREKRLSADDLDLAVSRMNLGLEVGDLGDRKTAMPLLEQAQRVMESRAPNSPDLAQVLDNLGAMHAENGEHDAARPLIERGLQIREHVFGRDHPEVANSLLNLANLLLEEKRFELARPRFERAIGIWKNAAVPDYKGAAYARSSLADLLVATGRFEEAERQHQAAIRILTKIGGDDNSDIADVLEEYAARLGEAGRKAEADQAAARARQIRDRLAAAATRHP